MKKLLKEKGIKQIELASQLNISKQALYYKIKSWEEKRRGFTIGDLTKIANILNKDLNFFI
ncbi:helix-turn-helix domain-containing protein [Cetobacterium ceti]